MEYEQGDIVSCIVEKITGTTVFVKIDGTDTPGSIVLSEIAPGRIRNLRDYVVPKKTIICKILDVKPGSIELSLRRVKEKEKKELFEERKLEKSCVAILKSILKEKTTETIKKIKEKRKVHEFLQNSKEDPKELEKLVGKDASKKIIEILKNQKSKTVILKKEIELTTTSPNGVTLIKYLLSDLEGVEVKYIAAGKYSLKREDENLKTADIKLMEVINSLEEKSKNSEFEIKYKQ